MTACPCAQELVMERSQERLREQGFTDDEVARVFEAVPVASHNQRGIGMLHIGCPESCGESLDAETLLAIVESAMSSEIYELMKRSDEVAVVETIHKHTVVAERHGLLGELRREVDSGERAPGHTTMRDWLEAA